MYVCMYVLIVYKRPYHAWLLITRLQFTTLQVSKNVGPIWGFGFYFWTTYLRWMKSQHRESFQLCPQPEGRGVGVWIFFFSAIIPPSVLCVYIYIIMYIYIYTVYDIYIYINVAWRSFQDFKLHSGGCFTEKPNWFPPCELLTNRHASFIMACCWAPVVISRVDLTGFFVQWNPQASTYNPHGDHGKVNQNSPFTTRFSPARPTDPPAILKSFACTSANSPQQKPKDDSRTITSETRKGRRHGENGWVVFLLKRSPFSKTCTPLQHPIQPWPKVSKNLHVKFFCASKIHTSVASCPTEKKT